MIYTTYYDSPIGKLLLACNQEQLIGLWMEEQKYFGSTLSKPTMENSGHPVLLKVSSWLERYFHGENPNLSELSLAPQGSPFRQRVWHYLCEIPYGEVSTYGEIAKKVAADMGLESMSSQAIGGAVGHNPISIIIPCHRVVGTDRSLTGFAGGIEKKVHLLTLEGVDISNFTLPSKGSAL